jgi:Na+/melibiose symporter-like transporter
VTTAATDVERAPPLGLGAKLLYAVGGTATNLKHRAISSFLVIFYNQVVGLPPQVVGGILMIALVFDAVLDPLIGQVSDNLRSRWGRRHPFMLVSAAPYAVAFFFLWNPPEGWSHGALAIYLAICLFSVRFFDTFFEVPHQALVPELVKGYDERTNLIALRQIFVLFGGAGMMIMALQFFLKENADGSGGVLARDGYFLYSMTGALIIFAAIILSTVGTAHRIPYLSTAPNRPITFRGMLSEVVATLNNRAFIDWGFGWRGAGACARPNVGQEIRGVAGLDDRPPCPHYAHVPAATGTRTGERDAGPVPGAVQPGVRPRDFGGRVRDPDGLPHR